MTQAPRIVCAVLAFSLSVGASAFARQAEEDKASKERRKQEQKALVRDQKDSKEDKELLAEIQPEIDALAIGLTRNFYQDRFLQDYVAELGQSLVPRETSAGVSFSFRIVNDASPNAFAFPDGRIYVHTGLLVFVQNEAQLATILGHEIGHVLEEHTLESIKDRRSFKRAVLPGLLGALAGAAVGGAVKGKEGAVAGAAIGATVGVVYSVVSGNAYAKKQEDEADRIGVRLAIDRGFDSRESLAFFKKLGDTFGEQDRFSNLLWGNHSRNVARMATIQALLDGDEAPRYNAARSAGKLTLGGGGMKLYTSRMFRDAAIDYMDVYDRWDIARDLLEQIVEYRIRDPKTLCAIARVYKMVGRTDADRNRAVDYLQRATLADERNLFPYVHRELGLMQARLGDPGAAVESLKKYVRGHLDRNQAYPHDLEEVYDYLLTFGDSKWVAPRMENVLIRVANPAEAPEAARAGPAPTPTLAAPVRSAKPALKKPASQSGVRQ